MRNMVDGESQIGSFSGDATRDIFEASLSAVHLHPAPVVDLANITWQSFGVRNGGCRYGATTPQAQQCHTHLYKNTGGSQRNVCRWKANNTYITEKTHIMHITLAFE